MSERRPIGYAGDVLTLYQAEWCPYSSAVRELLTELGLPFVAQPVEPQPEQREALRAAAGTDEIPVLEDAAGTYHRGTDEILEYLATLDVWEYAGDHRRRYLEHAAARRADVTAGVLERAAAPGSPSSSR